jgi:hypothetical protein
VRVLFTARSRRLASTSQAEAVLPAGGTAEGSRRALWKLRPASPGAGSRADPGSYWFAAPGRLPMLDVLGRPYAELLDYLTAHVQGTPAEASTTQEEPPLAGM